MKSQFSGTALLLVAAFAVAGLFLSLAVGPLDWFGGGEIATDGPGPNAEKQVDHPDGGGVTAKEGGRLAPAPFSSASLPEHNREGNNELPNRLLPGVVAGGFPPQTPANDRVSMSDQTATKVNLVIGKTLVTTTEHGPIATFEFEPSGTNPVGKVTVVAFLPPGSGARILNLSPVQNTFFSGVDTKIADNGWFAAFQGTPQETSNLSFQLSLSRPEVAMIKGNHGIEPFKIDLGGGR